MKEKDYVPGSMDASEHRKMYYNVMTIGGKWGTAFALCLAMFFTGLLLGWGFLGSLIGALVVFFAVTWIAQKFFMH